MREWCTLPYALARSSQQIARDLCFSRASAKMEESLRWYSVQPGTVDMKAFWRDGSRYPFSSM